MRGLSIPRWRTAFVWVAVIGLALASGSAWAQPDDAALVQALRGGGHTIYFRHAETDWSQQDHVSKPGDWTSCDGTKVRQLSDIGRETARRVGEALRALKIPVGRILSSEYCRAVETGKLMAVAPIETTLDIMNMRAAELVGGRDAVIARARTVLATPPPAGTNVIITAHGNLSRAATGAYPGEAGAGVFIADGKAAHGFRLVAELTPADWARLAQRFGGD